MNKEEKPSWPWTCHDTTQRKVRGLPHCYQKAQDGEHHSVGCIRDLDSRPWVRQAGVTQAWQFKRISNLLFFQTQQEHTAPLHLRQLHHSFSFCLFLVIIMMIVITITMHILNSHCKASTGLIALFTLSHLTLTLLSLFYIGRNYPKSHSS